MDGIAFVERESDENFSKVYKGIKTCIMTKEDNTGLCLFIHIFQIQNAVHIIKDNAGVVLNFLKILFFNMLPNKFIIVKAIPGVGRTYLFRNGPLVA